MNQDRGGVHEAAAQKPNPKATRTTVTKRVLNALLVLVVAYLMYAQVSGKVATNKAESGQAEAQQQAKSLAQLVTEACAKGGSTAAELGKACTTAAEVQQSPPPPPPGPSPADIQRAVADYLREHPPAPGRGPTVAEVTDAVAIYMAVHPPEPGRPPTVAEVADAVETYLRANPAPAGADGKPGPPPTAEEIAAAVTAYLEAHPPPPGQPGADGAPGPTCPSGYEPRPALIVGQDGATYQGVACVDPNTSTPPNPGVGNGRS